MLTPSASRCLALTLLVCGLSLSCDFSPSDYEIDEEDVERYFDLRVAEGEAATVPANGYSEVAIVAEVLVRELDDELRTILFSTTEGTLTGGAADGDRRKVEVGGDGKAYVTLRASESVGSARVQAVIEGALEIGDEVVVEFVEVDGDAVLQFIDAPGTAPADDATLTPVTVRIDPSVPRDRRTVTFTTTKGTFGSSGSPTAEIPAGSSDRATAFLKSPADLSTSQVQAEVAGVARSILLTFVRALPDAVEVRVEPFRVEVESSATAAVVATLRRDVGVVTPNTRVVFEAVDTLGVARGLFRSETATNSAGEATATFIPGSTSYRGSLSIRAHAVGSEVVGAEPIVLVDPMP